MGYQESVGVGVGAAAAALTRGEQANWELARLTCITTAGPGERPQPPMSVSLAQWAKDVQGLSGRRFSATTASVYRRLWLEYGEREDRPTWAEAHAALQGAPIRERFAPYELRSGLKLADAATRQQAIADILSPAERLDLVREQLADPTVRAEIATQPVAVRTALTSAVWEGASSPAALLRERRIPTGGIVERMDVLHQAALCIQRLATELDSLMIFDLLSSNESGLWPSRVALRNQLVRLKEVADHCIGNLPSIGEEAGAEFEIDDSNILEVAYSAS
jgi:hypothetical protein